ncbi:MAG: hypothetical protein J6586_11720, partial [Snodgrassella sp.]|nr:hypothetical protein [Snodgrassella sp.]
MLSSSSSPQDEFSASFTKVLGDSSEQGRKTDAELKGRSKNFEKEFAELTDSDDAQAKDEFAEITDSDDAQLKDDVADIEGRKLDF